MDKDLRKIHDRLGIASDYEQITGLTLQKTPNDLVAIGEDIYGRPQRLSASAASAWREMQSSARKDQVDLLLISAFRSIEYQIQVIERLLAKGESIDAILTRVAAPGFSEHQSGNAVDLASNDTEVLEEDFDESDAFDWLMRNAANHCFHLSYPKGNDFGVIYEPWHWCFREST